MECRCGNPGICVLDRAACSPTLPANPSPAPAECIRGVDDAIALDMSGERIPAIRAPSSLLRPLFQLRYRHEGDELVSSLQLLKVELRAGIVLEQEGEDVRVDYEAWYCRAHSSRSRTPSDPSWRDSRSQSRNVSTLSSSGQKLPWSSSGAMVVAECEFDRGPGLLRVSRIMVRAA